MITTGIYKLENILDGSMYIGSSSEIPNRKYNPFVENINGL